ncbi:hypothetical protein [Streptomyces sp. NPDC047803]|uniref:hypothetical protein n=1 Tax=Streptomyces TaxID=1883 RepID=UPI0033FFA7DB
MRNPTELILPPPHPRIPSARRPRQAEADATLAQELALDRAMAARQTCGQCKRRYYFCLPLRTLGVCDSCDKGYEPSPDTYMPSATPARHQLAA